VKKPLARQLACQGALTHVKMGRLVQAGRPGTATPLDSLEDERLVQAVGRVVAEPLVPPENALLHLRPRLSDEPRGGVSDAVRRVTAGRARA